MKTSMIIVITALLFSVGHAQQKDKPVTHQKFVKISRSNLSAQQALSQFSKAYELNDQNQFRLISTSRDSKGNLHQRFQQYYNNFKVEYGVAITHSQDGSIILVNGELYNAQNLNTSPQLTGQEALEKAKQDVNASRYLWEDSEQAQLMGYKKPEGELVVFPDLKDNTVHLAYKLDVYAIQPISRQIIYVDANNGKILFKDAVIKHLHEHAHGSKESFGKKETNALIAGTAATRYSGSRSIETDFTGTEYRLRDYSRGNGILTYNCQTTTNYQNVDFTDDDNNWTAVEYNNSAKDDGALDAHWGAEMTFDFWGNVFGRNSFDGNGAAIRSYVHYDSGFNNAFWNGSVMTYGDGSGMDIFTAIDVCGHEIGHAICSYTADLAYQDESGAMNEGFSDIWGACIEHYGRTGTMSGTVSSDVWLIGEDISSTYLRSMQNPNIKGDPDTYLGTYWYSGTADNGGVHTNSGVLNHWFYILAAGESGTNNAPTPDTYNVTGIGLLKAAEIAYFMERDYLTSNATYADARAASIELASSLYCGNSPEVMAVTDSWYAVNVGETYVNAPDDVALHAIQNTNLVSCDGTVAVNPEITMKNHGTNDITSVAISYSIDGGTATNLTWNGLISPCGEENYSFPVSGLTRGAHEIEVTTTIINDGRSENNTRSAILLVDDQGTIGVVNPFTAATDALVTYNEDNSATPWVRGIRTGGSLSGGFNNYIYSTNLSGNYTDMTKKYLVSQCYNLANVSGPTINFDMKYDLEENWDVVYIEYTTDFGATWNVLGTKTSGWYNSDRTLASSGGNDCYNCPGAQWTGTNTTNTNYSYPLTALNNETNVIFRIVFHSDEAVNQLGVNIDNFVINGTLAADSFMLNNEIVVYPNPSKGMFTVNLGTLEAENIEVYDISGKKVLVKENISAVETNLDLTAAAQGIYFVKINSDSQAVVKRIVKE